MEESKLNRQWMKSNFKLFKDLETDQKKGLPQPPLQKPHDENGRFIKLPQVNEKVLMESDIYSCLKKRRSHRKYNKSSLSLEELSFLLWATQGVDEIKDNNYATLRPTPSGGARHPFETYLLIDRVDSVKKGVYRYLPLQHQLIFLFDGDHLNDEISQAANGQKFVGTGAVVFIWSCIPYRSEWRYDVCAHKTMLLDAGHLCQNLYLASEAIGCGTCAIAAYDQGLADRFLGLDGKDEFVVYMAPVGKI